MSTPSYLGTALIDGRLHHHWRDGTLLPAFVGSSSDESTTQPDYLDEPSAAAFLGIPEVRLRKWRKTGRVPHFKPTHMTVLYDRRDLIALMEATRVEATLPPPAPRNAPKSAEHRANISAGQKRTWAQRKKAGAK